MARGKPGTGLQRTGPKPSGPTGRLVITSIDDLKNGGMQNTHWLPRPEGEWPEWECPAGCGQKFRFDHGSKSWQTA